MPEPKAKRIVYIEDDPELISLVSLILGREGFSIKNAHDGKQGLNLVREELPDLVLLDLMIPFLDGWEVYKQLEAAETTRDIPVIIITAKSQPIDRVLGLQIAKVDEYICKPFRPQALIESITRVLNTPRANHQDGVF
jgi:two-component system, OmpR family, response regulator VicR